MHRGAPHYVDRHHAGLQLAEALTRFAGDSPVVLGLARGGIAVAAPVARALGAPLDMLLVCKVGSPDQPELGIGAVAEGGVHVIDTVLAHHLGIPDEAVPQLVRSQAHALDGRVDALRRGHPRLDLEGRLVIVIDDGLATGSTAHAAIRSARRAGARQVILAVPVGSRAGVRRMEVIADEVICLLMPDDFLAVGRHYDHFAAVSDTDMIALLSHDTRTEVVITVEDAALPGILTIPPLATLLVIFAHGSGSSRLSPRNQAVAAALQDSGIATLLIDLLTEDEARERQMVFDIEHLADRLEGVVAWSRGFPRTQHLGIGLFGASTGAAAALAVAARCPDLVSTVVSRGGRPDLASRWLPLVKAPTLLIVGGEDVDVLRLNRDALTRLRCPSALEIVPGASHLFDEAGSLQQVAILARDWCARAAASRAA